MKASNILVVNSIILMTVLTCGCTQLEKILTPTTSTSSIHHPHPISKPTIEEPTSTSTIIPATTLTSTVLSTSTSITPVFTTTTPTNPLVISCPENGGVLYVTEETQGFDVVVENLGRDSYISLSVVVSVEGEKELEVFPKLFHLNAHGNQTLNVELSPEMVSTGDTIVFNLKGFDEELKVIVKKTILSTNICHTDTGGRTNNGEKHCLC
ncbi:MAG: hypothetical protein ABH950_07735 [Candidatus Altiarchaeota archaeon]